jgi:hypothetical protein
MKKQLLLWSASLGVGSWIGKGEDWLATLLLRIEGVGRRRVIRAVRLFV